MKPSVQKLLKPDGRALYVAMDHARDWGGLPGLERPDETIATVVAGGADGIMTTYGVAKQFGHLLAGRVPVIVRLDGWQQLYTVEEALRVGADGVIVNYFMGAPGESESLRVLAR